MNNILTEQEFHEHIERLANLPAALDAAVKGLLELQLNVPYREGGWSSRQVVHHLVDSHLNAYIRMKLVFTEDHPPLKPYNQDAWAQLTDNAAPIETSLKILRGLHERWAMFLKSIPHSSLTRTGLHAENGVMTLSQLVSAYAKHGETHVEQILGLRQRNGW